MGRKKRRIEAEPSMILTEDNETIAETPIRALKPVQVDTEGRRARFGSPPPPPGASPSLLIPTPGRDITNTASDLIPPGDELHQDVDAFLPLRPPVFEIDKSLRPSHEDEDTIKLVNWCFKLVPINQPILLSKDSSSLSHWIIVCGEKYRARGAEPDKTTIDLSGEELWHSSCIVERRAPHIVSTASGSAYELVGPCNSNISKERMSSGYCHLFQDLVPEDWVKIVCAEATQRGMLRRKSKNDIEKQRKMDRAAKRRESEQFFRDLSPLVDSPPRTSKVTKRVPTSPENAMDVAKRAVKVSTKSIPRELRQLQASKLGNLAMVQAAIIEGLEAEGSATPVATRNDVDILEPLQPSAEKVTPLRSSTRARNTVSEWWKVDLKSSEKKERKLPTTRMTSPVMKKLSKAAKKSVEDVFESDDGPSEDEYQQSGISSDSDHDESEDERFMNRINHIQVLSKANVQPGRSKVKTSKASISKQKSKDVSAKQIKSSEKTKRIEQFFLRSSPIIKPAAIILGNQEQTMVDEAVTSSPLSPSNNMQPPKELTQPCKDSMDCQESIRVETLSGVTAAAIELDAVIVTAPADQMATPQSIPAPQEIREDDTFYFSD